MSPRNKYGIIPYTVFVRKVGKVMHTVTRFDLTMNANEKEFVARAAALKGVTMASFVRSAAKEKARQLLAQETQVTMTSQDFQAFTAALNSAFMPNTALQNAINLAHQVKRV